jgi:hypothetical protein
MLIAIAASVAAFIAGAYAAGLLIPPKRRRKRRRKSPRYYMGPAVRGYDSPELHRELTLIRRGAANNNRPRSETQSNN